jgi:hypothetical protein
LKKQIDNETTQGESSIQVHSQGGPEYSKRIPGNTSKYQIDRQDNLIALSHLAMLACCATPYSQSRPAAFPNKRRIVNLVASCGIQVSEQPAERAFFNDLLLT